MTDARRFDDLPAGDIALIEVDAHSDPDEGIEAKGFEDASVQSWRMARALEILRGQINALAPNRSKKSDGGVGDAAHRKRSSDHNPWVEDNGVGVVTARDFTHDAKGGCDGEVLAEALRGSRDSRIKYIIWNRRICASEPKGGASAWTWRPYTGPNPHDHHVHISVSATKKFFDSEARWALTSVVAGAHAAGFETIGDLETETAAIEALAPLGERLADLQSSGEAAVAVRAASLLARLRELTRSPRADEGKGFETAGQGYEELAPKYAALWNTCSIRPEWSGQVAWHRSKLLQFKPRYEPVAQKTGAPWWFIGIVHAIEASFNFAAHLHNGDPLTGKTVHVPKGRPEIWNPPNDWVSSAMDAIDHQGHANQPDWSLARALYRFEGYNGFGYYKYGINSPYLWSFSNHYTKGKYVKDGVFDPNAVSKQCGAAVMLKALVAAGDIVI